MSDTVKSVELELAQHKIREFEITPALVFPPTAAVGDVIKGMQEKRTGCAVICDDNGVCGTFTERSVLTWVAATDLDLSGPVGELANRRAPSLRPDDTVVHAIRKMDEHNVRHLPVWDGSAVVGVLSVRDLINLIAQYFPAQVYNLPPRLRQRMENPEGA